MTRSVLNAQSVLSWHSSKTESRAQYCLFVMVSFIISHCKRNFPLDPYQCLCNFFLVGAPWAVAQCKAHHLQFRCCFHVCPQALRPRAAAAQSCPDVPLTRWWKHSRAVQ